MRRGQGVCVGGWKYFPADLLVLSLWSGIAAIAVAGALKIWTGLAAGSLLTLGIGIAELGFLAALLRIRRERVRCAMLLFLFTAFAAVSAFRFLTGAESCGCLGFLRIAPIAMLSFDALVALAALAALVWTCNGEVRVLEDTVVGLARSACAAVLVSSIVALIVAGDTVRLETRARDSLRALQRSVDSIRHAFAFELQDGDWEIAILRQSCPECREFVAGAHTKHAPPLVAIFVDDAIAFYTQPLFATSDFVVAPIVSDARSEVVATPSSVRMRNGRIVDLNSMISTKGV
jgi:hypothetical protein